MFCPHCGARLGDRPDLAGQWFSCPSCAAPFQVPAPPVPSTHQNGAASPSTASPSSAGQSSAAAPQSSIPQPAATVHAAHGAQPSAPLKAIPVKQAVAVSPAVPHSAVARPQQPHAAQVHAAQGHTAQPVAAQPQAGQQQAAQAIPVVQAGGGATRPAVHQGVPVPQSAPVQQGVPVHPTARRRRSPTAAVPRHPSDGLAITGLGLGLVGLPLGLAPYYGFVVSGFGAALGLAGILASVKLRRAGGLAVAALAVSGIGLCFQVTMWNQHWRARPEDQLTAGGKIPLTPGAHAAATPTSTAPAAPMIYEPWQELRPWTIGDKPVMARLKGWSGSRAILELENGETLNTSQSALSEEDRRWVAGMLGK
jgi:hypothetical protein